MFTSTIRMMIVGARQTGLSISATADLLGFSRTMSLLRMVRTTKKVSGSSADRNTLLMREVREEGQTGRISQEGDSHANNHALQQWYAEEHL